MNLVTFEESEFAVDVATALVEAEGSFEAVVRNNEVCYCDEFNATGNCGHDIPDARDWAWTWVEEAAMPPFGGFPL